MTNAFMYNNFDFMLWGRRLHTHREKHVWQYPVEKVPFSGGNSGKNI